MKDNFSGQAEGYARYRPVYPTELFDYIVSHVTHKDLAWDCGTGNGQTAIALSPYFKKVYASDISSKQLSNAAEASNIKYDLAPAEKTALADGSTDLITISQALHWFNHNKFYEEVKRVSAPEALIAAWTYNLLKIDPVTDDLINRFYAETLHGYWDYERRHVDDGYANIPFPFRQVNAPDFAIKVAWDTTGLEGYLTTWSAVQKFIALNNYNPVAMLMEQINQHWQNKKVRQVVFPLQLKIGKVF